MSVNGCSYGWSAGLRCKWLPLSILHPANLNSSTGSLLTHCTAFSSLSFVRSATLPFAHASIQPCSSSCGCPLEHIVEFNLYELTRTSLPTTSGAPPTDFSQVFWKPVHNGRIIHQPCRSIAARDLLVSSHVFVLVLCQMRDRDPPCSHSLTMGHL